MSKKLKALKSNKDKAIKFDKNVVSQSTTQYCAR